MKAIVCIGPSACGKSTFAQNLVGKGYVEINRDTVRFTNIIDNNGVKDWGAYKFNRTNEQKVTDICEEQMKLCVQEGRNIVISDTNLNEKYRKPLIEKLEGLGYEVEIKDDWSISHFEELVKRNENRQGGIGITILWNQWLKYLEYKGFEKYKPTGNLLKCVICDIDGTIADHEGIRSPFDWDKVDQDRPRDHVVEMIKGLSDKYEIVFLSGRDGSCRQKTTEWLNQTFKGWFGYDLYMRKEGDSRKDYIIKKELFDIVKDEYDVMMVVDDRHQVITMWEELGLNVINVGGLYKRF